MTKMLIVLALSFGSVIIGYIVQRIMDRSSGSPDLSDIAKWIKLVTLAVLLPWPILFTFWQIETVSSRYILVPILGLTSLVVGGLSALVYIRATRMEPNKAGSLFACGMMTNLGVVGGLVGMVFFGNEGFLTVQLFTMFEVFTYYLVVFPLSQQLGMGHGGLFRFNPRLLLSKPMSMIPLGSILIGLILRGLGVPAPSFLNRISGILVPTVTGLIGFSIGLTLKVSQIHRYRRESTMIALIKFALIPAVIIPLAYILGMSNLFDGIAFKMIVFLSFGPVALIAMVPPQIYGLDLDLANSGWLVTTVGYFLIVPVLLLLLV